MISNSVVDTNRNPIFIFDEVFNSQENLEIYSTVNQSLFSRSHLDLDSRFFNYNQTTVKWVNNINFSDGFHKMLIEKYMSAITHVDWDNAVITRQYVNYSDSTTSDLIHTDCNSLQKNSYTLLHYANYEWHPNWHGETLFYSNDCLEASTAITIRPGRLVLFDSNLQHSATAPSSIANFPRYTIATKIRF